MKVYKEFPLKSLTKEDIAGMAIYGTLGGLRRACAVNPTVMCEVEGLPKLYYREDRTPEGEKVYSIHATTKDLCRYLLMKSIETADTEAEN